MASALLVAAVVVGGSIGRSGTTTAGTEEIAATQAATCVQAINWTHAEEGRATRFLLWAWAKGSNTYIGWIWTSTALQEGPTGTWTMVPSCGPGGSTTSSSRPSSSTSTTRPTSTSTTRPSTTSSSTTTPPNGQQIYSTNCAVCHGADGSGGVGPDLRGIGEAHTLEEIIAVITNGRGAMPAWEGRLTPAQIEAVARYVASIPGDGHGHHDEH